MSATVLQLHKRASYEFKYIQDKYAISSDSKVFALADGTTQSFNSEIWAEIITNQFVKTPSFTPTEVINLYKVSVEKYKNSNFEFSTNPAKASLEKSKQSKGGTATFIGLRFLNDNKIELISCGDSNFFLLSSNNNITAYPFSDLDSLDANNNFINTEALIQEKIDAAFFNVKTFHYQYGDKLILATDAISRLLINKPSIINELLQIEDFEQLNVFCTNHWNNKELHEDDISAIILNIDNKSTKKIIIPPNDFTFPKEKEEEFIPTSLQQKKQRNYTDMQMNEIRNQFNGIANDFRQVKRKQKFHEMLIMVAISLVLFSFLYAVFFQRNPAPEKTEREIQLQLQLNDKDDIIQTKQREIDKLNKQLQVEASSDVKKEIKPIIKSDTPKVVDKPNSTQNIKKENKSTVKPVEKKQDSITTKEH